MNARTCQAKGRFLRFRTAKRMARSFQTPLRPEKPNFWRRNSKPKVGAMARRGKGVDEVEIKGEGVRLAYSTLMGNICPTYLPA